MSCEACDKCNNCNVSCNVTCNTAQGFCYVGSQLASSYVTFPDWNEKTTNSSFLTAKEWNDFIEFIYEAYCHGRYGAWGVDANEPTLAEFAVYDGMGIRAGDTRGKTTGTEDFMYAKMYNGALKKMHYLSNKNTNTTGDVNVNDIIYADTFNELRKEAKTKFKLHKDQCNACNYGCQGCNNDECDSPEPCCDDCSQTAG